MRGSLADEKDDFVGSPDNRCISSIATFCVSSQHDHINVASLVSFGFQMGGHNFFHRDVTVSAVLPLDEEDGAVTTTYDEDSRCSFCLSEMVPGVLGRTT